MARPIRIEYDGALYHVTSPGNQRKAIFKDDTDHELFLAILAQVAERFHWLCHAYCLMNNHYHLVIETPDGNLSKGMRQLNGVYTRRSTDATVERSIDFRGDLKGSWFRKRAIFWKCAATWCSTR